MILKVSFLMGLFFILAFIQGEIIAKGDWLINKKLPNHWMGHAVWGIFWVVTSCLIFKIITLEQWTILFLIFISAFPGIYLAGIKRWKRCNLASEILRQLKLIYQKLGDTL